MATNYTTNYQLNQWEPTDAVQRVEFNQDNAKLDTALKSLSDQVIQKANQSALNTLISSVNQKADASTVSDLSQTVASHTAQLAQKGDCQIYYATYEGDGMGGKDHPTSVTFPHKPVLVTITDQVGNCVVAIRESDTAYRRFSITSYLNVSWGEKSLSWWHPDGEGYQLNEEGTTYYVVAFLQVDA